MFPVEERKNEIPHLTMAQIEEAANLSDIQSLVGVLHGKGLPDNFTLKDIRKMRLEEKYNI